MQASDRHRRASLPGIAVALLCCLACAPAGAAGIERLFTGFDARPLWLDARGQPTPQAFTLAAELDAIGNRGLQPEDYGGPGWLDRVVALHDAATLDADRFRFEFEFDTALRRLVTHLHRGRIDPRRLGFEFDPSDKPIDLDHVLRALSRADDPSPQLTALEPPFPGHRRLRAAHVLYRELAAHTDRIDLPPIPGRVLEPGSPWNGSALLALRLHQLGDLGADALPLFADPPQARYEGALVEAVARFQRRHGLKADGRIGNRTLAALETPMSQRVEQIRFALERWRWTPVEAGKRRIVVNIPEFRLRALDREGRVEFESDVVVGAAFERQTPVFADALSLVVFQPSWHVPPSIVSRDLVPKALQDPLFLDRLGYEMIGGDGFVSSAHALQELEAGRLRLRQKPGPQNSLGRVKFLFPNAHNVYLHDTPSTRLFERARRDLSSGCVRVADPHGLATWVLREQPEWPPERIADALQGGAPDRSVALAEPIPVQLVYMTTVASEDGVIQFFDDIYGHDARLRAALEPD